MLERGRIGERWRSQSWRLAQAAYPELAERPARLGPIRVATPTAS
ncbi:hypothetical protein ACVOMV_32020 [Mesorhizobium atlanticum]